MISQVIKKFIDEYEKNRKKEYERILEINSSLLREVLKNRGIRAIVTFRAKDKISLLNKIKKKESKKSVKYKDSLQIEQEINDIGGLRIALYFPEDLNDVEKIIKDLFAVKKTKRFPKKKGKLNGSYKKTFSGYKAVHYIILSKRKNLDNYNKGLSSLKIEIQVATVLMHAWAEVEHDLTYKPLNGIASLEEIQILDEINGLVLAGDLALTRLQSAINIRLKESGVFSNEYDLKIYLNRFTLKNNPGITKYILGRVDILFEFLRRSKLDKPAEIEKYLVNIVFEEEISDQLINLILEDKKFLKDNYREAVKHCEPVSEKYDPAYYKGIVDLITKWSDFQQEVAQHVKSIDKELAPHRYSISQIRDKFSDVIDSEFLEKIEKIRKVRNNLVHNVNKVDFDSIRGANEQLKEVLNLLKDKINYLP